MDSRSWLLETYMQGNIEESQSTKGCFRIRGDPTEGLLTVLFTGQLANALLHVLLTAVSAVRLRVLHILMMAGAMWPAGVVPDATSSGCSMNCNMNWKGV